jgi:hypothetical protein
VPLPLYVGQAPTHRVVLVLQVAAPVGLPLLVRHDVLLPVVGGLALRLHPQVQDSPDELLLGAAVVCVFSTLKKWTGVFWTPFFLPFPPWGGGGLSERGIC